MHIFPHFLQIKTASGSRDYRGVAYCCRVTHCVAGKWKHCYSNIAVPSIKDQWTTSEQLCHKSTGELLLLLLLSSSLLLLLLSLLLRLLLGNIHIRVNRQLPMTPWRVGTVARAAYDQSPN